MGFTREQSIDALNHTSNLEQATEYVLTHPHAPQAPQASSVSVSVYFIQASGCLFLYRQCSATNINYFCFFLLHPKLPKNLENNTHKQKLFLFLRCLDIVLSM